MSAWTIYWILQLDSIGVFFGLLFIAGAIFTGSTVLVGVCVTDRGCYPSEKQDEAWERFKRTGWRVGAATVIVGAMSTFIPSTKTAAAMVVIPAIANNETIRAEAGDLYRLAKEALREAALGDEPKQEKSK